MKAIEFPEVNLRIAENQPEYETLPVCVGPVNNVNEYFKKVTACFQLDENELKQIAETGCIWFTVLQPDFAHFHPILLDVTKPEL